MRLDRQLLEDIQKTIDSGYYERRAPVRRERQSLAERIERSQAEGRLPLMAEVAAAWPGEGLLLPSRQAAGELIEKLSALPLCGLSVWVEPKAHAGDLRWLGRAGGQPLLAKDWIVDERQIVGGDAVLLKAPLLSFAGVEAQPLIEAAHEQDIEAVLEVYTPQQWKEAKATEADIIAVNNHGPNGGGADIATTLNLLHAHRTGRPIISMYGIQAPSQVRALLVAGASAVELEAPLACRSDGLARLEALRRAVLGKEPIKVS